MNAKIFHIRECFCGEELDLEILAVLHVSSTPEYETVILECLSVRTGPSVQAELLDGLQLRSGFKSLCIVVWNPVNMTIL
jgi:hypothetical protein